MDMNLRDWLVIFGVLFVLGILAEGLRRLWLSRRQANELNFGLEDVAGPDDDFGSELPNGGARVRGDGTPEDTERTRVEPSVPAETGSLLSEPRVVDQARATAADDLVDDLVVELESDEELSASRVVTQDYQASATSEMASAAIDKTGQEPAEPLDATKDEEAGINAQPQARTPGLANEQGRSGRREEVQQSLELDEPIPVLMSVEPEAPRKAVKREKPKPGKSKSVRAERPAPKRAKNTESSTDKVTAESYRGSDQQVNADAVIMSLPSEHPMKREPPEEVLIINVLAPEGNVYAGGDILNAFQQVGLFYGDMKIFHRHINNDGSGEVLFSVANGIEPGTFDLKTMEQSSTPALSFFMGLPGPEQAMQAFRVFVETVYQLREILGGRLCDELRVELSMQTLEHYRQRISDFERRQLTRKKSEVRI